MISMHPSIIKEYVHGLPFRLEIRYNRGGGRLFYAPEISGMLLFDGRRNRVLDAATGALARGEDPVHLETSRGSYPVLEVDDNSAFWYVHHGRHALTLRTPEGEASIDLAMQEARGPEEAVLGALDALYLLHLPEDHLPEPPGDPKT